ncbi:hypothetical protein BDQ94DRAFT_151469 [Aspergillus welwitschiae]|uniref:Uncharacterized protein n=1 Tax=Aspergillus welwitschiae TaxID=1341132 RepID=A0A3F3PPG5_9EURO|nr:hypothetical protein BDQ94DRAFT_151469 [Aspergillus welwitschiae]RDH28743.1 hypothetical protein BDQ94DRAFT_151469 [Aspergillus welwitschiae]
MAANLHPSDCDFMRSNSRQLGQPMGMFTDQPFKPASSRVPPKLYPGESGEPSRCALGATSLVIEPFSERTFIRCALRIHPAA